MLDISIKALDKELSNPKKAKTFALSFIRKHITVVEKIDGTKLTLVRNNEPFDPRDYTKNWIVAYKGSIIYPTEFSGLEKRDKEISKASIGTSQYKFIHDHLKRVHTGAGSVPMNTEFFIEFVQNKPTITRDYEKKHGMFLVGFGPTDFVVTGGQLYTTTNFVDSQKELEMFRKILKLDTFPVLFEGNLSSKDAIAQGSTTPNIKELLMSNLVSVDFSDPVQILSGVVAAFSTLESSLGGKAEGVVISVGKDDLGPAQLYKILASDQHDSETRVAKKSRWQGTEDEEKAYWDDVNFAVDDLLDNVDLQLAPNEILRDISREVYSKKNLPIKHSKKTLINIQDDIMLTAKLRVLSTGSHKAQKIAVIPMAAKPFHKGHDALIKSAVKDGNDSVIVFVGTGGREEIGVGDMVPLWRDFYIPGIKRIYGSKVIVRFSDSPMREASLVATDLAKRTGGVVSLYGDQDDASARVESIVSKNLSLRDNIVARSVDRSETGGISATQMRSFLSKGDEGSFRRGLPEWLNDEEKHGIWNTLLTKFSSVKSENLLRNMINLLLTDK